MRLFFLFTLLTLFCSISVAQQDTKSAATKIVFVCEHGSAKSVIAAKELEKMARERGISVQTISRGTTPDAEIPAGIRSGLKSDGIDVGTMKPVGFKAEDLHGATKVISFGPDVAAVTGSKAGVEDWSATPSPTENFSAARDYIVKRLQTLLDQMPPAKR